MKRKRLFDSHQKEEIWQRARKQESDYPKLSWSVIQKVSLTLEKFNPTQLPDCYMEMKKIKFLSLQKCGLVTHFLVRTQNFFKFNENMRMIKLSNQQFHQNQMQGMYKIHVKKLTTLKNQEANALYQSLLARTLYHYL